MRRPLLIAVPVVVLTGCAAHNDVMVFGTSTTIGLNVSAAAAEGGAPSLTLGYDRNEGVWMPLRATGGTVGTAVPNGGQRGSDLGQSDRPLFQSRIPALDGSRIDSYSVFASLGARFEGGVGGPDGPQADGGLAQFFATGGAAVNITENEALVTVLRLDDADTTRAQAAAVTAAAGSAVARAAGEAQGQTALGEAQRIIACGFPPNAEPRWATIIGRMNFTNTGDKETWEGANRAQAEDLLLANDIYRAQALIAVGQETGC